MESADLFALYEYMRAHASAAEIVLSITYSSLPTRMLEKAGVSHNVLAKE